jgi:tetratricopeptide (TPR) repeat protein
VRKELLRPDKAQIAGEDAFRFRHLLIRDAAYEGLPKSTRAELHERFAGWLEQHGRDLVELDEIVGYHFEQAHRYRAELGPLDNQARELGVRARERLAAAGQRALDRRVARAAVNLLGRALTLHEPENAAVSLRLDLAGAQELAGQLADADATATEAATRATAAADPLGALRARLHAEILRVRTDPEGSRARLLALVEEARPLFERAGDGRGLTEVCFAIANVELTRLHHGAQVSALEQAAYHARRAGDTRREREALAKTAMAHLDGPTSVEHALGWLDTQGAGLERLFPALSFVRAVLEAMLGRFAHARALVAAADERRAELGILAGGASTLTWRVHTLAGDHAAAERDARRDCELLGREGYAGVRSTVSCLLAQSLVALGRDEEAEAALALAEELSASDDITDQILARRVRAKLLARRGEHSPAERLARGAVAIAEQTDSLNDHGDALTDVAEVLTLAGRHEDAAIELEGALRLDEEKGNLVSAGKARARLAVLREAVASEP